MKTFFVKNWWSFIFNGAIAIVYGLLALLIPKEVLELMIKYTGVLLLLGGAILFVSAIARYRTKMPYGSMLTVAVLLLAVGAVITFKTIATIQVVVVVLGIWALLTGIFQLATFISFNDSLSNKGLIIANILFTISFGLIMLFNPFAAARILIVFSGILALVTGVLYLWYGFKLKKIK
jgi:uncharacterized membrane protein HdeD (DUF308 family)